jgi:hypothetical protein
VHRREQAQSQPASRRNPVASGKISGSVSRHHPVAILFRSSTA